jgi:hypothetical protein
MACDSTMGWERQDRRVFPLQCSHGVPNNSKSSQAQNSKTQISPTKEAKKKLRQNTAILRECNDGHAYKLRPVSGAAALSL